MSDYLIQNSLKILFVLSNLFKILETGIKKLVVGVSGSTCEARE